MIYTVFIKLSVCWVGDLLFCCFASRIPVGSPMSMKFQLQLAKATFGRWIFGGFTALGKSGRGTRWWLFPQSQPFGFSCPCFCGSCTQCSFGFLTFSAVKAGRFLQGFPYTMEHSFFWLWAYINASWSGIAVCGLLTWDKMGAPWAGGGFRKKCFTGEQQPYNFH